MTRAPTVFGKYRLLERLAAGGMAEVYKAKAVGVEGFEKVLVIKRILPEFSQHPDFVEMFIDEAKIAVSLSHANIVQVFDLGEAEGTYFIAMEYVAGMDLATMLRRGKRLRRTPPYPLAVYIASEIAKALDYAHRRRDTEQRPLHVVHRDVSPQNILISAEGEVKLTDFGIARARLATAQHHRYALGKYAYMSPEQARGEHVDGRTDLFSLGAVLYESLSGVRPFEADTPQETLRRVRTCAYEPLHHIAPHLPRSLCDTVHRALAPTPEERHENAGRLYEELAQALYASGQRITARDIAKHVAELGVLDPRAKRSTSGIRRLFLTDPGIRYSGPHEATPVEIPSQIATSGRTSDRPSNRRPSTRTQAERRDLTVLALGPWGHSVLPRDVMAPLQRFGATLLHRRPTQGWWHVAIGLDDPNGRDTDDAMRFFLVLRRSMMTSGSELCAFRAGVQVGRALVDADGELVRNEMLSNLIGDATAAAQLARPGQLLCTPAAERTARRHFDFRRADGSDHWTLLHARDETEALGKFLGRRNELRRFGELLAAATRGHPKVIAIVGEPGSGKSRFVQEAIRRLKHGRHDVGIHVARISPRSKHVPYSMLGQMMRAILGIEELDPEPVFRAKADRVRELGLSPAERDAIDSVVGLQTGTQDFEQTQDLPVASAVATITRKLAEDRLTLFVFDGIESSDPHSLKLLEHLLATRPMANAVVVLVHITGVFGGLTDLQHYAAIHLEPLPAPKAAELALSRLGANHVPEALLQEILDKSGGHPLHIEEYVRALQDAGAVEVGVDGNLIFRRSVADLEIPKTLRGLVAARLSRLSPASRHLIQIAAVVGGRFHHDVFADVSERPVDEIRASLRDLETAKLISCFSNDECAVTHDLIGEAVRDGLTQESRRELHLAIGEALVRVYDARLDEWAHTIAHHFQQGGARTRAVRFYIRAARKYEADGGLVAAVGVLETALDAMALSAASDRELRLELYEQFGTLCLRSRQLEQGATRMVAALDLADGLGRDDWAARFCALRGTLLAQLHRFDEGREWFERAHELARRDGTPEVVQEIMMATAEAESFVGNYSGAVEPLEEARRIAELRGDRSAIIRCLTALAVAYAATGKTGAADKALAGAHTFSGAPPDAFADCQLWETAARVHTFAGRRSKATEAAELALDIAKEHRIVPSMVNASYLAGENYLRQRQYDRAFAMFSYGSDLAREHGLNRYLHLHERSLGFLEVVRERAEAGRARIAEACENAERSGQLGDLVEGKLLLAFADHALGDTRQAQERFQDVLRLAEASGNRGYADAAREALESLAQGHDIKMPE